ncbi:serine aminopeptidase domain-containing protein [Bradyrhizobium japonicum]|uniref:serine aminopeptidase domain-containing protein n=1 Tax=Bradyrhizobium japonicum TaxID=375 RepID=UPI001BAA0533|nr:alpha/beta hydrolase [Bradyrhizobium japonicum]MBR0956641.1 alpha/beta fold hydrolase [Bradyrhizobium japonicum]
MRWFIGMVVLLTLARPVGAAEQELELSINGRTSLATLRTPTSMASDTPLVVMTHGTLAHKDMEIIQGVAKALEQRGIASLAHTLSLGLDRRKGMYDCATRHDYVTEDAVAEIGAWGAKAKSMSRFVFTLGHSRGGNQVARYLAANEAPPAAGAVLLAPVTAKAEAGVRASYAETYGKPLEPLLEKATKAVAAGRGGEWMDAPGFIYCRNAVVSARAFASFYGADAGQDTAALVARVKLPVLVLTATKDTVVPDVAASFGPLADSGSGGRVQLDKIEDADHFFRDLFAEDVADRIAEFIKQTR